MHATKLPKLVAATALAVTALGAAPLAQAGNGKHPDGLGMPQNRAHIIGVLGHQNIIGVLGHGSIIGVLKHPAITVRKAGGA